MAKSDKELTTEIVIAFINSWNAKEITSALQPENIPDLINTVYSTIHALDDK